MIIVFPTAVALCTNNFYLQHRQLITPSTKMSWNDFENGSSESERTLQKSVLRHDNAPADIADDRVLRHDKAPADIADDRVLRHDNAPADIADDRVLRHDNAPAHIALSIREFVAKKNIPALPYPPYRPDLAQCDFYLFPKLKSKLRVIISRRWITYKKL